VIVVENLAPSEIRTRFVSEFLGAEVGDWLKGIAAGITEANEKLGRATAGSNERIAEIAAIDTRYAIERRSRAQSLATELATALNEHRDAMVQYGSQLTEYSKKFILSADEREMLKDLVRHFVAKAEEGKNRVAPVNDALKRLRPFLEQNP
jgi:hypothetical protein